MFCFKNFENWKRKHHRHVQLPSYWRNIVYYWPYFSSHKFINCCGHNVLLHFAGVSMLGLVKSCIGTKFTSQFGDLIAVSILSISYKSILRCNKFYLLGGKSTAVLLQRLKVEVSDCVMNKMAGLVNMIGFPLDGIEKNAFFGADYRFGSCS